MNDYIPWDNWSSISERHEGQKKCCENRISNICVTCNHLHISKITVGFMQMIKLFLQKISAHLEKACFDFDEVSNKWNLKQPSHSGIIEKPVINNWMTQLQRYLVYSWAGHVGNWKDEGIEATYRVDLCFKRGRDHYCMSLHAFMYHWWRTTLDDRQ